MLDNLKWHIAQKAEKLWWKHWFKNHSGNDDVWLNTVLNYFELRENDFGDEAIVDIGSGPIGILTKLKARERITIGPLSIDTTDKYLIE